MAPVQVLESTYSTVHAKYNIDASVLCYPQMPDGDDTREDRTPETGAKALGISTDRICCLKCWMVLDKRTVILSVFTEQGVLPAKLLIHCTAVRLIKMKHTSRSSHDERRSQVSLIGHHCAS